MNENDACNQMNKISTQGLQPDKLQAIFLVSHIHFS